jgi:hypothetical protein
MTYYEFISVSCDHDDESDPGPGPIPPDALIEGGRHSSGDRRPVVLDHGDCLLYELLPAYLPRRSINMTTPAMIRAIGHHFRSSGQTCGTSPRFDKRNTAPATISSQAVQLDRIDDSSFLGLRISFPRAVMRFDSPPASIPISVATREKETQRAAAIDRPSFMVYILSANDWSAKNGEF